MRWRPITHLTWAKSRDAVDQVGETRHGSILLGVPQMPMTRAVSTRDQHAGPLPVGWWFSGQERTVRPIYCPAKEQLAYPCLRAVRIQYWSAARARTTGRRGVWGRVLAVLITDNGAGAGVLLAFGGLVLVLACSAAA